MGSWNPTFRKRDVGRPHLSTFQTWAYAHGRERLTAIAANTTIAKIPTTSAACLFENGKTKPLEDGVSLSVAEDLNVR